MPHTVLAHRIICDIVAPQSKVLDLGCGGGDLLALLSQEKKVKGQGIELNEHAIYEAVEKGLSVVHGDFETGLRGYPTQAFDYVILNQSMQESRNVDYVIREALRVGKKVIIGFPNFAFITSRVRILLRGKVPITPSLPYRWYKTPNLHFLSITDFIDFCRENGITILERHCHNTHHKVFFLPNLFALNAIFVVTKK